MPQPRRRRGSAEETRERLVHAAKIVFNRDGYFHTDSNRIAREAGYSPGTFYKHFADKREIFLAAYAAWVRDEWDALDGALPLPQSARQRAAHVVRVVLEHHVANAGFRASLRVLVITDDKVRQFVLEQRAGQLETLARLRARLKLPKKSRAEDWTLMLLLERVCDSIAAGEARALGVKEAELVHGLERTLKAHLS